MSSQLTVKDTFKAAFPKTLPVMAGYLVLGFGFGLLLQSKGYNFIWAFMMSTFIFAGSMQYVAVDLLSSGAGLVASAIMTLMINARHLFYGISMLVRYRDVGKAKPYLIFGLTDETYSLVSTDDLPESIDRSLFYLFVTALDHSYWIIGSVIGALFGQAVAINTTGVEYSMTALFAVIVTDNLLKKQSRVPAIIGIVVSFVCLMIFGPSNFLIPSMIAITAVLLILRSKLEKEAEGDE